MPKEKNLTFHVITWQQSGYILKHSKLTIFLEQSKWDDYYFKTTFHVVLFDEKAHRHDLGFVKIAYVGQEKGYTKLHTNFNSLDEDFFSLGQSLDYYKKLSTLTPWVKEEFLKCMKDIVFDDKLRKRVINEGVTQTSLLREISKNTLNKQFPRVLEGGSDLKAYDFVFSYKGTELTFDVNPDAPLPTNIHALIGGNGVGKTTILKSMISSFLKKGEEGCFFNDDFDFSRLISVSYSVFDDRDSLDTNEYKHIYIGLTDIEGRIKTKNELAGEFVSYLNTCLMFKDNDWLLAVENLCSDPIFGCHIESLRRGFEGNRKDLFKSLSSGHSFVLLVITALVAKLEEETLVLFDEPEIHLHPPLLSTFIHAISDLLRRRNAAAIVVTHSPVVVQEIPKQCVWKLSRFGDKINAQRFDCKTLGENFGKIMREVFGIEARESGFYKMIAQDAESGSSFEDIIQKYDNQLGSEARMILLSLLREKINE